MKTTNAITQQERSYSSRCMFPSVLCLLSSVFCLLVSVFCPLSSAICQTIDRERIEQFLAGFVKQHETMLPAAEIRVKDLEAVAPFDLPAGVLTTEVIPADPSIMDACRFTIIFRVDGRVVKNMTVRARLEAFAPVVVARDEIKRGMVIGPADIGLVKLDISQLRNPCLDESEVLGKKTKRSIRQGQPLDRAAVEFPPLIRRGELVTLVVSRGALTVTARGIARQDAGQDEPIRVVNSESQKEIIGRASGPGLVAVEM